jgi:hypothetical protein
MSRARFSIALWNALKSSKLRINTRDDATTTMHQRCSQKCSCVTHKGTKRHEHKRAHIRACKHNTHCTNQCTHARTRSLSHSRTTSKHASTHTHAHTRTHGRPHTHARSRTLTNDTSHHVALPVAAVHRFAGVLRLDDEVLPIQAGAHQSRSRQSANQAQRSYSHAHMVGASPLSFRSGRARRCAFPTATPAQPASSVRDRSIAGMQLIDLQVGDVAADQRRVVGREHAGAANALSHPAAYASSLHQDQASVTFGPIQSDDIAGRTGFAKPVRPNPVECCLRASAGRRGPAHTSDLLSAPRVKIAPIAHHHVHHAAPSPICALSGDARVY